MHLDEHRRAARTDVSLIARVRPVPSTIASAHRIPAIGIAVTDISLLGLSFLTTRQFKPGDLVEVDLSWRGADISFHGVVRHADSRSGLHTVGIQFLITASTKHAVAMLSEWLQTIAEAPVSLD